MSEPIPSQHSVGDTGHTSDHNEIVVSLAGLVSAVNALQTITGTLEGETGNVFSKLGGNVCNIPGTTTSFAQVSVGAGNRDTAADVIDIYYGGARVFSLNGYGELRISSGAASHVAAVIQGQPSQTGDLLQFANSAGTILARIASDGSITAPALTLTNPVADIPWVKFNPLSTGISIEPPFTGAWVRLLSSPPECIQISALLNVQTATSVIDGTEVAQLAAAYRPAQTLTFPVTTDVLRISSGTNNESSRCKLDSSGNLTLWGISSAATVVGIQAILPLDSM